MRSPVYALFLICSAWISAADDAVMRIAGSLSISGPRDIPAVRLALADLAADAELVLGGTARIVDVADAPVVVRIDPALGTECWRLEVSSQQALITGGDALGAVYGIYQFSERYFGIDPLWWWKDLPPSRRDTVTIPCGTTVSKPNAFRWRGWFVNDEDLLSEWKPGSGRRHLDYPFYQQVVATEVIDRMLEALLRSGGNLAIPASFIDVMNPPEAALVARVVERGLFITQHHIEPLGVSHFAFETYWQAKQEKAVFSYASNPDKVRATWMEYARTWYALAGDRIIWQLGLRGRGDRPPWASDKGVTRAAAGEFVSRAMADQWSIIRAIDPRPEPPATATLWMEGADLMSEGSLRFPPGTIIVYADEGRSQTLPAYCRTTPRQPGHGYGIYYHVAFWAEGPHLLQGTLPTKIKQAFDVVTATGDARYAIINVANIREHVLGIDAAMEAMRQGETWDADRFLDRWSPPELQDAYRDLLGSFVTLPGNRLLQDGTIWELVSRQVLPSLEKGALRIARDFIPNGGRDHHDLADALATAIARLDRTIAQQAIVDRQPEPRRGFHTFHLMLQARMLRHEYAWLRHLLLVPDDRSHLQEAIAELGALLMARTAAEMGKWEHWYRGDRKVNLPALLERTRRLSSRSASHSPGKMP